MLFRSASARNEHRVLTEDVTLLDPARRERVLDVQRGVVAAFADAVAAVRPGLAAGELHKPLTMLLFGMINWMFTWFRPGEPLTHEQMAPMVADLFLGGLGAVQPPADPVSPHVAAKPARRPRPSKQETTP